MEDSARGDCGRNVADGGGILGSLDLQTLFQTVNIPTVILDADGDVVVWNEAEANLVGVSRERVLERDGLIGEELYESGRTTILAEKVLAHPHDAHEVYDTVKLAEDEYSLLVGGDCPVFEDYSTVDVSGAGVWFIATAIYDDGGLVGVIEFTQPELASERRNLEVDQLVTELGETLTAYQRGEFHTRASLDGDQYIIESELLDLIDRTNELGADLERMEDLRDSKQRLEDLTARLELALEETDTGVWEWELATDELVWDEASERLYGYDVGEFPGTYDAFTDRVLDEDLPAVERQIDRAIEHEERLRTDFRIRLPDGGHRWLQSRGIVEYDDGEPSRMLGVQTDITTLKSYERKLEEQRDNLEALNQIVRHDIRNKLQIVGTYAEVLETELGDEYGPHAERVSSAARDAIDITTTAREVTEVTLRPDSEYTDIELRTVLEHELEAIRSNYDAARVELAEGVPAVTVRADEMLGSVFRNLLTNAIQHSDKDAPEVTVSTRVEADRVAVRIADDGPGIPDDRKAEIFEQDESGLDSDGTGLGLYIVDTLVGRYGGEVRVEDNHPEGAVFVVVLPIAGET